MATACVAPRVDAFQETGLLRPKIPRQLKIGFPENARRGAEAGKYPARPRERCDSAASVQCRPSTPTLRVCNPTFLVSTRSPLDPAFVCAATYICLEISHEFHVSRFVVRIQTALPAPAQSLTTAAVQHNSHLFCVIEGVCAGRRPPTIDCTDSSTALWYPPSPNIRRKSMA